MDKLITLEDLTKAVQNNYSKLIKEGQVKSILRNIGVFVDQTVDNSILILLQNPDATCVKRLKEWNYYKRNIKKDEKAIKIISHHIYSNNLGFKEENGKIYTDGTEKLKVEVGYLFDIAQTVGKNYEYLNTNKETIAKYFDCTKKALEYTAKGYKFVYDDCEESYQIDNEKKEIHIKDGMTLDETINTLIKAVSIVALNSRHYDGLKKENLANIDDVELYGTIYAVNSRLGLDLPECDFSSLENLSDEQLEDFKGNLQKIRSVSKQLIANVESNIEYTIRNLHKTQNQETKQKDTKEQSQKEVESTNKENIEASDRPKAKRTTKTKSKQNTSEVE